MKKYSLAIVFWLMATVALAQTAEDRESMIREVERQRKAEGIKSDIEREQERQNARNPQSSDGSFIFLLLAAAAVYGLYKLIEKMNRDAYRRENKVVDPSCLPIFQEKARKEREEMRKRFK